MIRRGTKKKYRLRRNRKSSITRRRTNKKHSLRRYTKSKKKSLKKSRSKRGGSYGDKIRYIKNDPSARGPGHYAKEALRYVTGIRRGLLAVKNKPNDDVPNTGQDPGPTLTPDPDTYLDPEEVEKNNALSIYKNPKNTTKLDGLEHGENTTINGINFEKFNHYGEHYLAFYNKREEKVILKRYSSYEIR